MDEIKVAGDKLKSTLKQLVREGNVRRVIVRNSAGRTLLDMPLSYTYSYGAAIGWFFVMVVLAVLASWGPARGAVRLTIREVLAYE